MYLICVISHGNYNHSKTKHTKQTIAFVKIAYNENFEFIVFVLRNVTQWLTLFLIFLPSFASIYNAKRCQQIKCMNETIKFGLK